ncbi:hypothetical protein B0H10DRAFT_2063492 [Mycena sp. CBHHK59/15]|nr:hypothetical protein B0H10DRAFT_2063492 [Mycena sp. CBHHK59/15]
MSALRMLIREAMGHDPLFREGDRWGAGVAVLPRRRRVCGGVERDTVRCGWAAGIRRRRCAGQRYALCSLPFYLPLLLPPGLAVPPSRPPPCLFIPLSLPLPHLRPCAHMSPAGYPHSRTPASASRRARCRCHHPTAFYACRTAVRIAGPGADSGRAQTGREAIRASTSLCSVVLVDLCSSYLRRTTPLLRGEQRFRKRRAPSPTSSVRPVA